jgi:hypothetical protein
MIGPYYDIANQCNNDVIKSSIFAIIFVAIQLIPILSVHADPTMTNNHFRIEITFSANFEPSSMTFLGQDDILVLDRDEGKVYRVTQGINSATVLDVNVGTDGYRGLLGVVATVNENESINVFLYFTESPKSDGDDVSKNPVIRLVTGCTDMI